MQDKVRYYPAVFECSSLLELPIYSSNRQVRNRYLIGDVTVTSAVPSYDSTRPTVRFWVSKVPNVINMTFVTRNQIFPLLLILLPVLTGPLTSSFIPAIFTLDTAGTWWLFLVWCLFRCDRSLGLKCLFATTYRMPYGRRPCGICAPPLRRAAPTLSPRAHRPPDSGSLNGKSRRFIF